MSGLRRGIVPGAVVRLGDRLGMSTSLEANAEGEKESDSIIILGSISMDRLTSQGYSTAIEAGLLSIPVRIRERLNPHFLTGTDPVYAGLHSYEDTDDGRKYSETAHTVYEYHQTALPKVLRRVTIVLPSLKDLGIEPIIHELGHVFDHHLGFRHCANPINEYARMNRREAFAEAFTAWVYGDVPIDRATEYLFDQLAY